MKIYSRAEWGARYRNGVGNRTVGRLEKWAHHTVTKQLSPNASFAEDAAQIRVVEGIGQSRFGAGMSYTFLIPPSGRVFEGVSINRISYHTGGRNTVAAAICFVGNTEVNEVTEQQFESAVWLLQYGKKMGWWNDPALTGGHRDLKPTSCPGRYYYNKITTINKASRGEAITVAPKPKPAPNPAPKPSEPTTYARLYVDGYRGALTVEAWQILLKAIKKYDGRIDRQWGYYSIKAEQEWLRDLGYYRGRIDGKEGPMTIKALQRFLTAKRKSPGRIDGRRGTLTVKAEQRYLNDQRQYL